MLWIKHPDTFSSESLGSSSVVRGAVVPRDARCFPALQCQQPCAGKKKRSILPFPRESPCTGRCPVGSWWCWKLQLSHCQAALVSSRRGVPDCWQMDAAVPEQKTFRSFAPLCSPQISTKPTQDRKGSSPTQWLEMPGRGTTVTSQSQVPRRAASKVLLLQECSKHPRPGVTTDLNQSGWFGLRTWGGTSAVPHSQFAKTAT